MIEATIWFLGMLLWFVVVNIAYGRTTVETTELKTHVERAGDYVLIQQVTGEGKNKCVVRTMKIPRSEIPALLCRLNRAAGSSREREARLSALLGGADQPAV